MGVNDEKAMIEEHLDILKDIADKVRGEEIDRINRITDVESEIPISGEVYEDEENPGEVLDEIEDESLNGELSGEIDHGSNSLSIGQPIKSAKKIKSMKKIKSITDLTDEQAARLKMWQEERNGGNVNKVM